ncbi:MAG: M48 family metalloprotease [Planctomycetota bacterium]|nr:M48 family metalloprotease [Planctomycetota bacterium]
MRAGFRDHIVKNRWKLRLLLMAVFGLTAFAGYTLGHAFERMWEPERYHEAYEELYEGGEAARPAWYLDYPNHLAAALVLLVFVQYLRIRRRGDRALIALVGGRRLHHIQARNVTHEMALAAGIEVPRLYVTDDDSLNAFACGSGERGTIIVTSGLLRNLDRDELQAVIAHETAHIRNGDTKLMTVLFGMSRVFSMTAAFAFGPMVALWRAGRDAPDEEKPAFVRKIESVKARFPKGPFSTKQKVLFGLAFPFLVTLILAVGLAFSLFVVLVYSNIIRFLPWIALALAGWELWKLAGDETPNPKRQPRRWSWMLFFVPVGLVAGSAILLLGAVFPFVFLIIRLAVSRNQEFTADASAVDLTRNPDALASALRELRWDDAKASAMKRSLTPLAIARVGNRTPIEIRFLRKLRDLFSTHPSLDERIERLQDMGASPPPIRLEARPLVGARAGAAAGSDVW